MFIIYNEWQTQHDKRNRNYAQVNSLQAIRSIMLTERKASKGVGDKNYSRFDCINFVVGKNKRS